MKNNNFKHLLLKTAFSVMACDGDIDQREIDLILQTHKDKNIFGDIDIHQEFEKLRCAINENCNRFLKDYFNELSESILSNEDALQIIETAIEIIKADNKIEYSEIKFFKVIRSKLTIDNEIILSKHPDYEEYLEQDILSDSYLSRFQDDFIESIKLPEFKSIELNDIVIKNTADEKDNK